MLSDAEAEEMVRGWGLDPANLRAADLLGSMVWHYAGIEGRIDMCRWAKTKELIGMINNRENFGSRSGAVDLCHPQWA